MISLWQLVYCACKRRVLVSLVCYQSVERYERLRKILELRCRGATFIGTSLLSAASHKVSEFK